MNSENQTAQKNLDLTKLWGKEDTIEEKKEKYSKIYKKSTYRESGLRQRYVIIKSPLRIRIPTTHKKRQ